MTGADGDLVVIGVGNVLLRDDGVGVLVVRELEDRAARGELVLPLGTRLIDGGTLGRNLLPEVAGALAVVVVDAVDVGGDPGTTHVLRGAALRPRAGRAALSREGAADVLDVAILTGTPPEAVALVGVQPASVEPGLEVSPAVRDGLAGAVAATLGEIERLARPPERLARPPERPVGRPRHESQSDASSTGVPA